MFYVDNFLMFSPSKDKIDDIYAYIQAYFKIEYNGEINKYLGIDLEHPPIWLNKSKASLSQPKDH